MDRQRYYDMFPERGYGNDRGGGFGRFLSAVAFKFDLWLKGDPVRQCRQIFRRDEDDDFTVGTARVRFNPKPIRGDGHRSVSRKQQKLSRSIVILASPRIPQSITVAATATAIVEGLKAKRNEEPEWKKEWAEWVMTQRDEREDETDTTTTTRLDALPNSEDLQCAKGVDEEKAPLVLVPEEDDGVVKEEDGEDVATPPVTPPTSPPSSTCGADVSWSRSSSANEVVPWDTTVYYF